MLKNFITLLLLIASNSYALDNDDNIFNSDSNWVIDGNAQYGRVIPLGSDKDNGTALGGGLKLGYQNDKRTMMIYGELGLELFNNTGSSQGQEWSKVNINTATMWGSENLKARLPIGTLAFLRDTMSNEDFKFRFTILGVYLRLLDKNVDQAQLKQMLEVIADVVFENIDYNEFPQNNIQPPKKPRSEINEPINQMASSRNIGGIYAALKYTLEKNNWGGVLQIGLEQEALVPESYTKVDGKILAYRRLPGKFKNLKPYIELDGTLDHDAEDPKNKLEGALRTFVGLSGSF